jgi:hypothetical protein
MLYSKGREKPETTPLIAACIAGKVEVVKYLIQAGVEISYFGGDVKRPAAILRIILSSPVIHLSYWFSNK